MDINVSSDEIRTPALVVRSQSSIDGATPPAGLGTSHQNLNIALAKGLNLSETSAGVNIERQSRYHKYASSVVDRESK